MIGKVMIEKNGRRWRGLLGVVLLCVGALVLAGMAPLEETASSGAQALLVKYPALGSKLQKNQFGAPIYLESTENDGSQQVDMYGVFNYPFEAVSRALQSPANWCDITSLHINIKACTARKSGDHWQLTVYSGRKYYQAPAETYPLKLTFKVAAEERDYLSLKLSADDGPLRTKDHRIRLEAAPLDHGRTFLHFSYAYRHGAMANLAIKTYFATLARDKYGFTVLPGGDGRQNFIGGVRGAVERNTVRYYLALQTYLDTLAYPESQRFEARLNRWYDLTSRYPKQLKEQEKVEYLSTKRQEHRNQVALQSREGG